jgi:HEAT repeat protein
VASSAAWVLGELRATRSAPVIVSALRKGTLPPAAALRALAGAGTAEQVPVVLEFVADPSPAVREEALRAATALLDPARPDGRAVEPLAATLRAPRTSPGERAAVATLLGRTGAPRAATELAGLVTSKDATLRLAAIDALGALGSASTEAKPADGVADDALVPLLADADPSVRLHTAVALAASGGVKAEAALLGKLDGGDEVDRYAVLAALGGILARHPSDAAASRLFRELALAAGPERDAVLEAAGRARLPTVLRSLTEVTARGDADDRRTVASVLGAQRGSPAALALVKSLTNDADATVRAQAAFTLGSIGDASALAVLFALARSGDADVATNAAGGVARYAASAGKPAQAALGGPVCSMLGDGRAAVRANALVALSYVQARCGDGRTERKLLAEDTNDLVRAAAARAISTAVSQDDRAALDRCVSSDRSAEVARLCRPHARPLDASSARPRPRAVTVFVVGETGAAAKPRAPFLLEYEGGILRAGVADRRGATFEAAAPPGEMTLRRAPAR